MFFLSKGKKKIEIVDISSVSKIEQKNIKRIFTRTFGTEDGKKALAYLQYMTFHRSFGSEVSDEQLRHIEGQRSIVSTILKFVEQGRQN